MAIDVRILIKQLEDWKQKNPEEVKKMDQYKMTLEDWRDKYNIRTRQILAGKALKLLVMVEEAENHTKEDLDAAFRCFWAGLDGGKQFIDILMVHYDNKLTELIAKYSNKESEEA